jgi:hypothetical protein
VLSAGAQHATMSEQQLRIVNTGAYANKEAAGSD